jgi:hypothetical protein
VYGEASEELVAGGAEESPAAKVELGSVGGQGAWRHVKIILVAGNMANSDLRMH